MKKIFVILGTILALVACSKAIQEEDVVSPVENQQEIQNAPDFVVNLNINRSDDLTDTKANIKSSWYENDVIYIFFKGIDPDKYLAMQRNSEGQWACSSEGINAAILAEMSNENRVLSALYLPYGYGRYLTSNLKDGVYVFEQDYEGYFLQDTGEKYEFFLNTEGRNPYYELRGDVNLKIPTVGAGEVLVHFDITGHDSTSGYYYSLYQKYVKPISVYGVGTDNNGTIVFCSRELEAGKPIPGHFDYTGGFASFSGALVSTAVGKDLDYQFFLEENRKEAGESVSKLYARSFSSKKRISSNKYIGLGSITANDTKWTNHDFVDLGLKNPAGERLLWATKNVGATNNNPAGDHFLWGEPVSLEKRFLGAGYDSYAYDYTKVHDPDNLLPFYQLYDTFLDQSWAHYPPDDPEPGDVYKRYNGPVYKHRSPDQADITDQKQFNFYDLDPSKMIKYTSPAYVTTVNGPVGADNLTTLDPDDDPATVNWGAPWRSPTADEWNILGTSPLLGWEPTTDRGMSYKKSGDNKLYYYYYYLIKDKVYSLSDNTVYIELPFIEKFFDTGVGPAKNSGTYWSSSLYLPAHAKSIWAEYDRLINEAENERDQYKPDSDEYKSLDEDVQDLKQAKARDQLLINNYHPIFACAFNLAFDGEGQVEPENIPAGEGNTTIAPESVYEIHTHESYMAQMRIYGLSVRPVFTLPN